MKKQYKTMQKYYTFCNLEVTICDFKFSKVTNCDLRWCITCRP